VGAAGVECNENERTTCHVNVYNIFGQRPRGWRLERRIIDEKETRVGGGSGSGGGGVMQIDKYSEYCVVFR